MTPENFAYWLQGYFEISGNPNLTASQVQEIKNHLQLVFKGNPFCGTNFKPASDHIWQYTSSTRLWSSSN